MAGGARERQENDSGKRSIVALVFGMGRACTVPESEIKVMKSGSCRTVSVSKLLAERDTLRTLADARRRGSAAGARGWGEMDRGRLTCASQ